MRLNNVRILHATDDTVNLQSISILLKTRWNFPKNAYSAATSLAEALL